MPLTAEDLAYSRIRDAIINRNIRRGTKLTEVAIAQQLDLSRTPVRSALKRLAYEGFVEFTPNRGAQVIQPTEEGIRQTFAVRAQLEKMAASLAAERVSRRNIEELTRLVEKEQRVFREQGQIKYYETNDTFHLLIANIAGNDVLYSHIENLLHKTKLFLILYDPFDQLIANPSPEQHKEIVACLAEGDCKGAEATMANHLMSALDGIDMASVLPEKFLAL